jgi:hypothetical protein
MDGICRPLSPLNQNGLFQPTTANLCRGFAAAFCQVLVVSLENQLAGIFQHNGLNRV